MNNDALPSPIRHAFWKYGKLSDLEQNWNVRIALKRILSDGMLTYQKLWLCLKSYVHVHVCLFQVTQRTLNTQVHLIVKNHIGGLKCLGFSLNLFDLFVFLLLKTRTDSLKGIENVRFYTSLCQESSLLSRQSVRRLLCPFSSSPRLKTRKVLSFGCSGLSFGRYLQPDSFQREITFILARVNR
jgi:hypothetical protein